MAFFPHAFIEFRASALALIAANMLPLFGVVFLGWSAFEIVALYWAENVLIGMINVLKIITCSPNLRDFDLSQLSPRERQAAAGRSIEELRADNRKIELVHHGAKLFLAPFFAFHYGFFCLVHGMFVMILFGSRDFDFSPLGAAGGFLRTFTEQHLWWAVAGLALSHLYSFFVNFLGRGEFRRATAPSLMTQPYARVIVLHFAILFGGWIVALLGSNTGVLAVLVVGKTIADLKLHLREHERIAEGGNAKDSPAVLEQSPTASL